MARRIPEKGEDLVGKVCSNSSGRLATVIGKREFGWGVSWIGIGFDGKGTWATTEPVVEAESALELHDKLLSRYGGGWSHLDNEHEAIQNVDRKLDVLIEVLDGGDPEAVEKLGGAGASSMLRKIDGKLNRLTECCQAPTPEPANSEPSPADSDSEIPQSANDSSTD